MMHPASLTHTPRVFEGVRFDVYRVDLAGRGGRTVRRETCVTRDAVVILPMLDEQTVVLIRNERFAVDQNLWELPAGTIEPGTGGAGEKPLACAVRELTEETGYRAARIEPLAAFYPSPGICTELMHAFVAHDLTHVGQQLDENERITVEVTPLAQSIQMVRDNTIRDGKTIATLLYYHTFTAKEA